MWFYKRGTGFLRFISFYGIAQNKIGAYGEFLEFSKTFLPHTFLLHGHYIPFKNSVIHSNKYMSISSVFRSSSQFDLRKYKNEHNRGYFEKRDE